MQTLELLHRSRDFLVGIDGQVQIEERRWEKDSYDPSCRLYKELFVGVSDDKGLCVSSRVGHSKIRRFEAVCGHAKGLLMLP